MNNPSYLIKTLSVRQGKYKDVPLDPIGELMWKYKAILIQTNRVNDFDWDSFASLFYCLFVDFFQIWRIVVWEGVKEIALRDGGFAYLRSPNQDNLYVFTISFHRGDLGVETGNFTMHNF